jgi:hypothetical protein
MTARGNGVHVQDLELGADGATEWAETRRTVFVPRDAVVSVQLRRGIAGERPLVQVIVGSLSIAIGLVILSGVTGLIDANWAAMGARLGAGSVVFMILGGWILWTGIRPAYYLRVVTRDDDARKLVLHGKVDLAAVSAALHAAQSRFGYATEWQVEHPRPPAPPFR